jgi:hypothetical protein
MPTFKLNLCKLRKQNNKGDYNMGLTDSEKRKILPPRNSSVVNNHDTSQVVLPVQKSSKPENLNPVKEHREFEALFNSQNRNELLFQAMKRMKATPDEIEKLRIALQFEMGAIGEVHHPLIESLMTQLFLEKLRENNRRAIYSDFEEIRVEANRLHRAAMDAFGAEVSDRFNVVVDRAEDILGRGEALLTQFAEQLLILESTAERFGENGEIARKLVGALNDGVASATNLQVEAIAKRMDQWLVSHKINFENINENLHTKVKSLHSEVTALFTALNQLTAIKVKDLAVPLTNEMKLILEEEKKANREENRKIQDASNNMLFKYIRWSLGGNAFISILLGVFMLFNHN